MSLRRASACSITRTGVGIFARYEVRDASSVVVRLDRRAYEAGARTVEDGGAVALAASGGRTLWWTADGLFWDEDGLDAEAVSLLTWDRRRRQEARLDRLRKMRESEAIAIGARRERIPDDVRLFVWHRDEGRCVRCASEHDLQFDHVIPVARGGGNAAANIQILCGACNRAKSDAIS